jgi:hypothetical protein
MEPSLWQHQTIEPITGPAPRDMAAQVFACGVLVGIVIVTTVLLWRRSRLAPSAPRRRSHVVRGWGDLLRLIASVAHGVLWLVAVLLLLGRLVFFPAGRRW